MRRALAWAFVADALPIYGLYALLFADRGLSSAQIALLFAIWSGVAVVVEVPSGALADVVSRRAALVAAGVLQGAGFALWLVAPTFAGFAGGFVLWALAGALVSGAFEALLYDGLASAGADGRFARVLGWVTAAGLVAQVPAAAAASLLFAAGGYALAGWVSVGLCLVASALAWRLPEARGAGSGAADGEDGGLGYLATLRAGVGEAARVPAVRRAVIAVAALFGLDALEEVLGLVARDLGVSTAAVPVAVVGIPLAGAAGAALGGRAAAVRPLGLAALLGAAAVLLGGPQLAGSPVALVAITVGYGLYRLVLVVAEARLQERIEGRARATVTSVAGVASEGSALLVYAAWAVGELTLVAGVVLVVALAVPRLLR